MRRFTLLIILFSVFLSTSFAQPQKVEELEDGIKLIEDFEGETAGTLPQRWFNQKATVAVPDLPNRDTYAYKIMEEDGNTFLRFEGINGKHLNFPTKEVENIDIYNTPILSWRWRIHDIPTGADDEDNDVAASIYVVMDVGSVLFKEVPKSIRYTWSSNLEKGEEFSKFFGNQKTVVMGTGSGSGSWQTFERNIVQDYIRLHGDEPPKTPIAILILSDGDDTGENVKADYDDIMLKSYLGQ